MNKLNKKFLVIFSFSLLTGAMGMAQSIEELNCPTNNCGTSPGSESRFETIGRLFDTGTLPTNEDLNGWYSGRCYMRGSSSPEGSILVSTRVGGHPSDENGPEFPENQACSYIALHEFNRPPAYFDTLTPDVLTEVSSRVEFDFPRYGAPTVENGSLVIRTSDRRTSLSLRKAKGYLVMESSRAITENSPAVFFYNCYYFKRLK